MFNADIPVGSETLVERSVAAIDNSVKPGTSNVLDQAQLESAAKSMYEVCEQLKQEVERLKPEIGKVDSIKGPNDKDIDPGNMILKVQSVLVQLINKNKEAEVDRQQLSNELRLLYTSMLGSQQREGLVSLIENYGEVSDKASDIPQVRNAVIMGKIRAEKPLGELEKKYPYDKKAMGDYAEIWAKEKQAELAKKLEEETRGKRADKAAEFKSPNIFQVVGQAIWNGIKAVGRGIAYPFNAMADYIVQKLASTPPATPTQESKTSTTTSQEETQQRHSISEAQLRSSISQSNMDKEVDPMARIIEELGLEKPTRREAAASAALKSAGDQYEVMDKFSGGGKPKAAKLDAVSLAVVGKSIVNNQADLTTPLPKITESTSPNQQGKVTMAARARLQKEREAATKGSGERQLS